MSPESLEKADHLRRAMLAQIDRVYVGEPAVVEFLLTALLAEGHVLLEGVPGVAKTTLVRAFAQTVGLRFKRIQFTPDLLPADITGSQIPRLQDGEFILHPGPIFAQVVLGDEINRAPPRTQSALLEAMQERQVTIDGDTHALETPFLVLATQNPIEQYGVHPLPEAQVDRFLMKLTLGYPSEIHERRVLRAADVPVTDLDTVTQAAALLSLITAARSIHVSETLSRHIVRLVRATREHPRVALGASPRASVALLRACRALALMRGRDHVLPDDIHLLALPVLAHRIIPSPEAALEGLDGLEIIRETLTRTPWDEARTS